MGDNDKSTGKMARISDTGYYDGSRDGPGFVISFIFLLVNSKLVERPSHKTVITVTVQYDWMHCSMATALSPPTRSEE